MIAMLGAIGGLSPAAGCGLMMVVFVVGMSIWSAGQAALGRQNKPAGHEEIAALRRELDELRARQAANDPVPPLGERHDSSRP